MLEKKTAVKRYRRDPDQEREQHKHAYAEVVWLFTVVVNQQESLTQIGDQCMDRAYVPLINHQRAWVLNPPNVEVARFH